MRVRTERDIDGQRNFTGTLTAADDATDSLDEDSAEVTIPLEGIRRSNLVPELPGGAA